MHSDYKSPYHDREHPDHQQAVAQMTLAYKFLNSEIGPADEDRIVREWAAAGDRPSCEQYAVTPSGDCTDRRFTGRPHGPQRARTRQPLDARQKEIVERHDQLEAQHNAVARKEQASAGGVFKTTRPHYVHLELYRLEVIKDPRERVHAIRAWRSEMRDNPTSAFNNLKHAEHKNAIEWVQRSYQAESEIGVRFPLIARSLLEQFLCRVWLVCRNFAAYSADVDVR
jgi:hypothetical protein